MYFGIAAIDLGTQSELFDLVETVAGKTGLQIAVGDLTRIESFRSAHMKFMHEQPVEPAEVGEPEADFK